MSQRHLSGSVVVTPHPGVEQRLGDIQALVGDAAVVYASQRNELAGVIERAEVVAGHVPQALFPAARRSRWIHSWATGVDAVLHPELIESDVIVTCASGNSAYPIAEHCLLLMLMLQQQSPRMWRQQQERRYQQVVHPELYGKTLGLIGLGSIGREIAKRARAFGMRVLGMRRGTQPCPDVDELYPHERLRDLIAASDFVVMAVPLTPETAKMIGEAEFRAMKPTAYFVNVSRGGCVDEEVLIRAMREGWIAGTGIDQPTLKPLPPDSPLWDLPNTILTPGYGGHTPESYARGIGIFLDNLECYVNDQPLKNVVDRRRGY